MKFQQPESAADTTTTSVEGATAAAAAAAAVSAAPRLLGSLGRLLLLVLLGQSTACNSLPRVQTAWTGFRFATCPTHPQHKTPPHASPLRRRGTTAKQHEKTRARTPCSACLGKSRRAF